MTVVPKPDPQTGLSRDTVCTVVKFEKDKNMLTEWDDGRIRITPDGMVFKKTIACSSNSKEEREWIPTLTTSDNDNNITHITGMTSGTICAAIFQPNQDLLLGVPTENEILPPAFDVLVQEITSVVNTKLNEAKYIDEANLMLHYKRKKTF